MDITPVKIPLTEGSEQRMKKFLRQKVRGIRSALRNLHEQRVVRWRKAYDAVPAEATREFPFHNASNLVVPIIAIHSDTLLARVMAAVVKTKPMWTARIIGTINEAEELRDALEEGMQYLGLEPAELDLYRVYHEWFGETIKFGTSVVKTPWINIVEDEVISIPGDGTGGSTKFSYLSKTLYDGPRPEKIAFEDFGIAPHEKTVESANFKYHVVRMDRFRLEEKGFLGIYDKTKVQSILTSPDRTAPSVTASQKERDLGIQTSSHFDFAEWDIYECHFKYKWSGHYVRCIVWYHEKTDTILRAFFHYYPDEQFVAARLFYRDDMFHGYGFAERLEPFQEEISQEHNGRRDNVVIANTKVWRVHPDSKLHNGYRIYPGVMLPADENEIEALDAGQVSNMTIDEERLSIELSEKLSGVSAPQQGYGAGTNTKRGVYTAMGTLSLLQEGNTRTDLNVTDIRYAHTKLGRILARQYGHFGLGEERIKAMGQLGERFNKALDAMSKNTLALPIYASTASVNREVEKQNDLMFTGIMAKHYQSIAAMMQMAQNPVLPENVKTYFEDSVKASNLLMRMVSRHFGYDEVERMVPEAKPPEQAPPQGQPPSGGMAGGAPGGPPAPGGGAPPNMPGGGVLPSVTPPGVLQ